MHEDLENAARRILVIDDNRAIHEDFRKIFEQGLAVSNALLDSEAALFGAACGLANPVRFELDFATQGAEGAELVTRARAKHEPYSLAFVDMRMPPGWDGIETISQIWALDPQIHIVICTAYSDHSWDDIRRELGYSDRLVILKKPFDNIEVLQLASALTEKWRLAALAKRRMRELETLLEQRNAELRALQGGEP